MRHLIRSWRERAADTGFVWLYKRNIVGCFDGIPLVSLDDNSTDYIRIITSSLALIRDYDPKRFLRVREHTRWLVNQSLSDGAYGGAYQYRIKATQIDFELGQTFGNDEFHAAYFAGVIVHEATHGELHDKGFISLPQSLIQIERICRAEENRFLGRLRASFPRLPTHLIEPLNPMTYTEQRKVGRFSVAIRELRRGNNKSKREQVVRANRR